MHALHWHHPVVSLNLSTCSLPCLRVRVLLPPRVFFSFHYGNDIWRANQVRNSWVTHGGGTARGRFVDASLWEATKLRGDAAVQQLIDEGLAHTDATVVLIGSETAERRWVRYEIEQSWLRNNAIVGVRINRLKDQTGQRDPQGPNPFARVRYDGNHTLGQVVQIYDWTQDSGYENLAKWIEDAPRRTDYVSEEGVTLGQVALGVGAIALGAALLRALTRGGQSR